MLLYIDESGRVHTDDVFAVGLLIVRNPKWLQERISRIREKYNFSREFHLVGINRKNYPAYREMVEILRHFDQSRAKRHFRFRTVCILGQTRVRKTWKEHLAYNHYVEWALRHNLHSDMLDSTLYLDQKSRYDKDDLLLRLQMTADTHKPGTIKKVEEIPSDTSDLMQFCDVLTGTVRFGKLLRHGLIPPDNRSSSRGRLKEELWSIVEPYFGKSMPVSCHEIQAVNFENIRNKYQ